MKKTLHRTKIFGNISKRKKNNKRTFFCNNGTTPYSQKNLFVFAKIGYQICFKSQDFLSHFVLKSKK